MDSHSATLEELATFLNFGPDVADPGRATVSALKRLGVARRGKRVAWATIFDALLIDTDLGERGLQDLKRPLMRAEDVAQLAGVHKETIHRWHSLGEQFLPKSLSLGGPRMTRWIRAEIEAWHGMRAPVSFRRRTLRQTKFGALPTKRPP